MLRSSNAFDKNLSIHLPIMKDPFLLFRETLYVSFLKETYNKVYVEGEGMLQIVVTGTEHEERCGFGLKVLHQEEA